MAEETPGDAERPREGTVVIDQFGLAFSPTLVIVRTGGAVTFTNSEGALTHNVQVKPVGDDALLVDEDAAPGDRIEVPIEAEGGFDVLCSMHPGMTAFVFSTYAPYAVAAASDGRFEAGRLPPGVYDARSWSVTSGWSDERRVEIGEGPTELLLDVDG